VLLLLFVHPEFIQDLLKPFVGMLPGRGVTRWKRTSSDLPGRAWQFLCSADGVAVVLEERREYYDSHRHHVKRVFEKTVKNMPLVIFFTSCGNV
jgi:hypothetical protein